MLDCHANGRGSRPADCCFLWPFASHFTDMCYLVWQWRILYGWITSPEPYRQQGMCAPQRGCDGVWLFPGLRTKDNNDDCLWSACDCLYIHAAVYMVYYYYKVSRAFQLCCWGCWPLTIVKRLEIPLRTIHTFFIRGILIINESILSVIATHNYKVTWKRSTCC